MFTLKVDKEIELQLFQLHHAGELFYLVDTNRHHLRKWLPWVDSIVSPLQYHEIIPMWLRQFSEEKGFNTGIRYKGILKGAAGFNEIDWANSSASIGYYLAADTQGKGIMTRVASALIHHAFYQLGLNRIEVRCGTKNLKSRAIPERLGFTKEGTIRDGEKIHGKFHDLVVYGMLAKDWTRLHT
ncbi:GNAT family N-acetyltransferase [Mesobacillus harenae]|uniref:GNAT family N-acetyltransferase n=1 Tax=Mesobacillus harenae TaxID=2213203 RepID=UPI001580E30C|nr:GNAT family protein [Mesobacillus harenae]